MLHLAQSSQLHRPNGLQTPPAKKHCTLPFPHLNNSSCGNANQFPIKAGVNAATLPQSSPDLPCWKAAERALQAIMQSLVFGNSLLADALQTTVLH